MKAMEVSNGPSVFDARPYASGPYQDPDNVRRLVLKALSRSYWLTTADLYAATKKKVKRDLLHEVLKSLLAERVIVMHTIKVPYARHRTEFRLIRDAERRRAEI